MIRFLTGAVLLLALTLTVAGCGKHGYSDDEDGGPEATPVPEVTVAKVQRLPISEALYVSGNLAALPNRDARLAALVPGRIAKVNVVEGDRVRAGVVLAEVENTALSDQEHQAEAAVAQARANVRNAQLASARNEDLLKRGIAAKKEVEDAQTQLAVSEAMLKQAEAALSASKTQVERLLVRAPFAGTVVHRFLGAGEQVDGSAAQPIVEVADIDTLELLGTVPALRLPELKIGEAFPFETDAAPGRKFQARVAAVLPAVDPATNNGTVRIRISNPGHDLKLGEYISLELPLKSSGPKLVVPRQAIYPDESGQPHIYKVTGDEAQSVAVQVGIESKDQAQIVSGVNEGDTVVVSGGYGLPEKSRVRVKP